ncbi:hypothetical protein TGPRC2_320090 [Toxoplasma gondii TgCatPRC2]|uniref:Uncharacterized protein n=1 Tax=Toxoplasma gondii TgCatPRC2 TaxID=1130821 RepID=A0A151HBS8_TOXGO|nr:hypothetical protein TGPRC2_320090 [Toxoplasma gondii TgCatPRC2]
MVDLQDQPFSGSADLDTPIPASIMYDSDLSKIFAALAAPLLQSQELGMLSHEDCSADTNAEDCTPRTTDQDGIVDAYGAVNRSAKGSRCLSDQSPRKCQADLSSDLTFAALKALAGHLESLEASGGSERCSPRARKLGRGESSPGACEEGLREHESSDRIESSRMHAVAERQRLAADAEKVGLGVERPNVDCSSGDAVSMGLQLEDLSSGMALFGRGLKRAASQCFDGEGFADASPTDSTRSGGDGPRSDRRKSPKIGDTDSGKRSDCELLGVDQLLKEDLEDVLELEQATSQLLLSDSDSTSLRETQTPQFRGLLDLPPPAVKSFDVHASRSPDFGFGTKTESTGQPSTGGLPSILPRSFRSRSDYLSLCSLQTGSSDLGKEREPRSLEELKSLAGNEELGLTEIHILAEGLAKEFMETCCARLRPEGYRNCRLKYRRDNLSFTVVSKSRSRCSSPRIDSRNGRYTPRSALKEGPSPWSSGAGMFATPFGSSGGHIGLAGNPSVYGEMRLPCGSRSMGESGVNDSTVAAVVHAFLKATSILADATVQLHRERLGAGAVPSPQEGFRPVSNTKAEYQLEAFRRSA